jgi:hypothetical protein
VASLILLLFAFGIPFKQIPDLLDFFPLVKLLRATGRFTWPFFFVITTLTVVFISKIHSPGTKKMLSIAYVLLLFAEALPYHTETANKISVTENIFRREKTSSIIPKIEYESFQAIMPLPYFHYGSESYRRPIDQKSLKGSIAASYHSTLPILASNLARISIDESKKMVQLVSPACYTKLIENDIEDNRPILLVVSSESELTTYEQDILNKAKFLTSKNNMDYYELQKEKLFADTGKDVINSFMRNKDNLAIRSEIYCIRPTNPVPSGYLA